MCLTVNRPNELKSDLSLSDEDTVSEDLLTNRELAETVAFKQPRLNLYGDGNEECEVDTGDGDGNDGQDEEANSKGCL